MRNNRTHPDPKSKRTLVWSVVTLLLAVQAVVVGVLVMKRKDKKPTPPSPELVAKKGELAAGVSAKPKPENLPYPSKESPPDLPPDLPKIPTIKELTTKLAMAKELVEQGRTERALAVLEEVRKGTTDQELLKVATALELEVRASPLIRKARASIRTGKWQEAANFLDQVLIMDPHHKDAKKLMPKVERGLKRKGRTAVSGRAKRRAAMLAAARERAARERAARERAARAARAKAAAPKEAVLQISSKPAATAYVDGIHRGETPLRGIKLPPGTHLVTLKGDGLKTYTTQVALAPGQVRSLEIHLETKTVTPPAVATKPTEPVKPPATPARKPIPRLRLPAKVNVDVYKDGEKKKYVKVVCIAVERVVSKAVGKSAGGKTRALQNYLYSAYRNRDEKVTLYPRTMGYVIAQGLVTGRGGIGSLLVTYQKSGKMASLTSSNWRP